LSRAKLLSFALAEPQGFCPTLKIEAVVIEIDIPRSGIFKIQHIICDFSGTLSVDGVLLPGIKEKLNRLADQLEVHILTSDTHGKAREELKGLSATIHILEGEDHTGQKEKYTHDLGAESVIAIGNGNNDRMMLKAARIGICVCLDEGCSTAAIQSADIFVKSIDHALGLLLSPKRLIATLRV
jgi:soluble P-type ATPase